MKYKILVVEDDCLLAEGLCQELHNRFSCVCERALTLKSAKEFFRQEKICDLLILDRLLPDGDGLELLAELKHGYQTLRILVISRLGNSTAREFGLKQGANDYLPKPFTKGEFFERVRNLLTMMPAVASPHFALGDEFIFKPDQRRLLYDDREVKLTRSDAQLLEYFFQHCNFLVTKEEIERCLWKSNRLITNTAAIAAQIYRLRKKMGRFGEKLQTLYDFGYQLNMVSKPMKMTRIACGNIPQNGLLVET